MSKSEIVDIPVDAIDPGRYQPRTEFSSESLEEMAESIESAGLTQPIVVRPADNDRYELMAGERRLRAVKSIGAKTITSIIRTPPSELSAALTTVTENIQRVDLNPIEEGRSYEMIGEQFGLTQSKIAALVGKPISTIKNKIRLTKLPDYVQEALIDPSVNFDEGHAKALAGLTKNYPAQVEVQFNMTLRYNWTVAKLEKQVSDTKELFGSNQKSKPADDDNSDYDIYSLEEELSGDLGQPISIKHSESGVGSVRVGYSDLASMDSVIDGIRVTALLNKEGKQKNDEEKALIDSYIKKLQESKRD